MFAEGILLRRLIRSLKDRHSVLSCRIVQLRFDAFLEKREGLFSVFVQKNSRQSECLMWTKIQHKRFDVHLFTSPPAHPPTSGQKWVSERTLIMRALGTTTLHAILMAITPSLLDPALDLLHLRDFSCHFYYSIDNQGRGYEDSVVCNGLNVLYLDDFGFDTQLLDRLLGPLRELIAPGSTHTKNFNLFRHPFLLRSNWRVMVYWQKYQCRAQKKLPAQADLLFLHIALNDRRDAVEKFRYARNFEFVDHICAVLSRRNNACFFQDEQVLGNRRLIKLK